MMQKLLLRNCRVLVSTLRIPVRLFAFQSMQSQQKLIIPRVLTLGPFRVQSGVATPLHRSQVTFSNFKPKPENLTAKHTLVFKMFSAVGLKKEFEVQDKPL